MKTFNIISALFLGTIISLGVIPQTAEAGLTISYSSGDWSYHGHKHYHKYGHKHGHKYRHKKWKKHAHRDHYYTYNKSRYYRPHRFHKRLHKRLYHMPRSAKFVWIDGRKYYTYRGAYYQRSDCGTYYYVIDKPYRAPIISKKKIGHYYDDTVYESNQREFVVHIRDKKGDLVTVRLTKELDGYVGPQGEYYPEFPKVAQLREMYIK